MRAMTGRWKDTGVEFWGRAETVWVMVFILAQGVGMFWGFIESGRQRTKRPRKKVSPSKTGFWIFLVMEEGIKGETYQEHKEEI